MNRRKNRARGRAKRGNPGGPWAARGDIAQLGILFRLHEHCPDRSDSRRRQRRGDRRGGPHAAAEAATEGNPAGCGRGCRAAGCSHLLCGPTAADVVRQTDRGPLHPLDRREAVRRQCPGRGSPAKRHVDPAGALGDRRRRPHHVRGQRACRGRGIERQSLPASLRSRVEHPLRGPHEQPAFPAHGQVPVHHLYRRGGPRQGGGGR